MSARLSAFIVRRSRSIVIFGMAVLAVSVVFGMPVVDKLSTGGYEDSGSESARADRLMQDQLGGRPGSMLVVFRSSGLRIPSRAYKVVTEKVLAPMRRDRAVSQVDTFWSTHDKSFVSADRHSMVAVVTLKGNEDQRIDAARRLQKVVAGTSGPTLSKEVTATVGGLDTALAEVDDRAQDDFANSEMIAAGLLFLLLVVGGLFLGRRLALVTIVLGLTTVSAGLLFLWPVTELGRTSIFASEIVLFLGLGLTVDYCLIISRRYRSEYAIELGWQEVESTSRADRDAIARDVLTRTFQTTGKHAVLASALIVALSMLALLAFPFPFLRSTGAGGAIAALLAAVMALLVLPAWLVRSPDTLGTGRWSGDGHGKWYWGRWAHALVNRPLWALAGVAVLVALALPIGGTQLVVANAADLPAGSPSREVAETISRDFPAIASDPIQVITDPGATDQVFWLRQKLIHLPGVRGVSGAPVPPSPNTGQVISVAYAGGPYDDTTADLVRRIRDVAHTNNLTVAVGGEPAVFVDIVDGIWGNLWKVIALMFAAVLVVQAIALRSLVIPVVSVLLNAATVLAVIGAMKVVFQDGALGIFESTAGLNAIEPPLVFAVAFGLSVDYTMFLMSRVREALDEERCTARYALTRGITETGAVISIAALLLSIVAGAFCFGSLSLTQQLGFALVLAIVLDTTVVRLLILPAVLRLLGDLAWYYPRPLQRKTSRVQTIS